LPRLPWEQLDKVILWAVLLHCLTGTVSLGQKPGAYKGKEEKLPRPVPPQPIAFNHKKHASAGLSCLECHARAAKKDQAGLPATEQCMICHDTILADSPEVKKLADAHRRGGRVKWVRVYQVPDFVFFSHASHLKAGEQCVTCHGPVHQRDVLAKEVSTNMTGCMNCHSARKASTECSLCHQLGH
jgi:Cytochrome c7 and related cytochrome c/Class III cytochrome C family